MAFPHSLFLISVLAGQFFIFVNAQCNNNTCLSSFRAARRACLPMEIMGCATIQCDREDGEVGYNCAMATPSPTACPAQCQRRLRPVTRNCTSLALLGCRVEPCTFVDPETGLSEGGHSCVPGPITTPVPTACPNTCVARRQPVRRLCRELTLLGCALQRCDFTDPDTNATSRGFSCADPTPTPTACTNICRADRREVSFECKRLSTLGCRINRCIVDLAVVPSTRGFTCSMPSPAPTACPNQCLVSRRMANIQCRGLRRSFGCRVVGCAGGGFTCSN